MSFHDESLFEITAPVTSLLAAADSRRAVVFSRGKLHVLRFDAGAPVLERTIAIDDDAAEPRAAGNTIAWYRLSKRDIRSVDLDTQVVSDRPTGWEAFAGTPLFLGAFIGYAAKLRSRAGRAVASPDLAWLAVTAHRPDVDVLFATSSTEEAKALPKGVRVLAVTNHHVLLGTKKKTWQLLAVGTWKKLFEGPLPGDFFRAVASPGGRWFAVVSGRPYVVSVIDARSGALVGEHPVEGELHDVAWVDGNAVAYRHERANATRLGLLRLPLPDADDSVAAAAPAKTKSKPAAAKPSRSAQLGLPFELEWSTPESELNKLLEFRTASVSDKDLAEIEAMIVQAGRRNGVSRPPPIGHAAALLLRNPYAPVNIDDVIAKRLDDPHVQAVIPLLDVGGKRRLATIRARAGHALTADEKRAVTADAVTVWARTSRRLALSEPSLTESSPYARLVEVVERYGDPSTLAMELQTLWTEGRAKTLDHLESHLDADFATFARGALANPKVALAAFERRRSSPRFATDSPDEVRALVQTLVQTDLSHDWDRQVAVRAALAYAVLALARESQPLPDVATRILDKRILSPLIAAAGIALGTTTSLAPEYPAWVAALTGDWSGVAERIADAARAKVSYPDLAALADYVAAHVPDDRAEALALALRGGGPASDRAAFSILFRLRDAGRVKESVGWFDFASRIGNEYRVDDELKRALRRCSSETQRAVVEHWLSSETHLAAAGEFEPERAIQAAILRGDDVAFRSLATEERRPLVQRLLVEHIAKSANADALLLAIRSSVPREVYGRLEQLAKRDETPLQRLQRLVDAAPGPKREFVFLVEQRHLADKGFTDQGTPARSRIDAFPSDHEEHILSVHFDDCPELKTRFPGAASISVFAKTGKPSRVPTRTVAHAAESAEHRTLESTPSNPNFAPRVFRVLLPAAILGRPGTGGNTNDINDHRVIADLLPYASFVLDPTYAFVRGEQPILTVTDSTVPRGGEGDEGRLLVFANGKSYCEYAGSGW